MKKPVRDLYDRTLKLSRSYVEQVLGLSGEQAVRVCEISGGISADEAGMLADTVESIDPVTTLEIGLGYGFSAMVICEAAERNARDRKHILIDPHQTKYWDGRGIAHLNAAGHGSYLEFHEAPSFQVLPELVNAGEQIDFAFVDGWHTFDHVFVDFFYIDKLLRPGGVVAFDDADWPSVRTVIRYIVRNLSFSVYRTMREKKPREQIDIELGIEGSCIALRKNYAESKRDIFFHKPF